MSGHRPGRLGTCPICGQRFTNDDKDVKLAVQKYAPFTELEVKERERK